MRWYLDDYRLVMYNESHLPMRHLHERQTPRGCSHALSQRSTPRLRLIICSESLQDDWILDSLFQVAGELFLGQCLENYGLFHPVTEWAA